MKACATVVPFLEEESTTTRVGTGSLQGVRTLRLARHGAGLLYTEKVDMVAVSTGVTLQFSRFVPYPYDLARIETAPQTLRGMTSGNYCVPDGLQIVEVPPEGCIVLQMPHWCGLTCCGCASEGECRRRRDPSDGVAASSSDNPGKSQEKGEEVIIVEFGENVFTAVEVMFLFHQLY